VVGEVERVVLPVERLDPHPTGEGEGAVFAGNVEPHPASRGSELERAFPRAAPASLEPVRPVDGAAVFRAARVFVEKAPLPVAGTVQREINEKPGTLPQGEAGLLPQGKTLVLRADELPLEVVRSDEGAWIQPLAAEGREGLTAEDFT